MVLVALFAAIFSLCHADSIRQTQALPAPEAQMQTQPSSSPGVNGSTTEDVQFILHDGSGFTQDESATAGSFNTTEAASYPDQACPSCQIMNASFATH